jgi:hypothetical protein
MPRSRLAIALLLASCGARDSYFYPEPTSEAVLRSLREFPSRWLELRDRCMRGIEVRDERVGELHVMNAWIEKRSYYGPWANFRLYEGGSAPAVVLLTLVFVPDEDADVMREFCSQSAAAGTNRYRHLVDQWWLFRQ